MKKAAVSRINRLITSLVFALLLGLPLASFAQTIETAAAFIHSPVEVSQWFTKDFKYETEFPDNWQTAEETLASKKGDCEDFAILAQEILARQGIKSDIMVIQFKGLSQAHAVCIFKTGEYYSFISNQELIQTSARTINAAIEEQYPDWEKVTFSNAKKQNLKVVLKGKNLPLQAVTDIASGN